MSNLENKKIIQKALFEKAKLSIMNFIQEKNISLLKKIMWVIEKDYVIVIFNNIYAFQYKWEDNSVFAINGLAKSLAIDSIKYASKNIDFQSVKTKILMESNEEWI